MFPYTWDFTSVPTFIQVLLLRLCIFPYIKWFECVDYVHTQKEGFIGEKL